MIRSFALAAATLALAACGGGGEAATGALPPVTGDDIVVGSNEAPLTLIEYASITCSHCRTMHEEVIAEIKADYIETGKLRYVFREFPTAPIEVSVAGSAVARCAGSDKAYDVIDDLFESQAGLLSAARAGAARTALQTIAVSHGLDGDAFSACLDDDSVRDLILQNVEGGQAAGVTGTPALFLNGRELGPDEGRTAEAMRALLDARLDGGAGG